MVYSKNLENLALAGRELFLYAQRVNGPIRAIVFDVAQNRKTWTSKFFGYGAEPHFTVQIFFDGGIVDITDFAFFVAISMRFRAKNIF